ncbi:MAG: chromosomal replication initiator protein DnaA, partial [Candidatus Andersenbacteria bacterium]|nr:chromosomal replication initiator protein DnaA [Candidatus Andersenbacteria bacterium]
KDRYRNVDVLIIDDVQFLAGKGKTQEELFHTFNALYGQNKQIVLSSDRQPRAIPTFEERLRSRLTGGMIVDIQQPNYETRLAILEEKAARSDIKIEGGALAFIAKNIQKNVRELEGALSRVIVYCELNKSTATLEYTKKILEGILDKPQKSIDSNKIIETVSVYYSLSFDELKGKCRKQDIVRPRQIAMYLLRKENSASFPSIGHQFGGRDHTTAMHACEKIEKLLEHDEELLQDINFIKERLYA